MRFGPNNAFSILEERLGRCCGINALHFCNCHDPKLIKTALETLIDHGGAIDIEGPCGMLTYSTLPEQEDMAKALKAAGFEIMATCRNPRTDNLVTLWGYVIEE